MELDQTTFNEVPGCGISSPCEPHMACVLLLNTSGSMSLYIKDLENAIQKFIEDMNENEITKRRVDVAVIEFNDTVNVIQEFTPICLMKSVKLSTGSGTSMGEGIKSAIEKVRERTKLYQRLGTPHYRPWIFMFTDGAPTDDITEAREMIRNEEKHKSGSLRLCFFALGVGELYDKKELLSLTEKVLDFNGYDFSGIFNMLAGNMLTNFVSRVGENPTFMNLVGENLTLTNLPSDAHIIPEDW